MKKKILILGSNSFSGNHLVHYLLKKKFFVIGCSLSKMSDPKFNCLHQLQKHMLKDFKFERIDINKKFSKLEKLILKYKPDIIIDFLGQGMVAESWYYPFLTFNTNVMSKIKLYKFLSKQKYLKKYIKISTQKFLDLQKLQTQILKVITHQHLMLCHIQL